MTSFNSQDFFVDDLAQLRREWRNRVFAAFERETQSGIPALVVDNESPLAAQLRGWIVALLTFRPEVRKPVGQTLPVRRHRSYLKVRLSSGLKTFGASRIT